MPSNPHKLYGIYLSEFALNQATPFAALASKPQLPMPESGQKATEVKPMLWTIFVLLLVLWLLGVVTSYTLGGFIHLLLVVALVVLLIQLFTGRRPVL